MNQSGIKSFNDEYIDWLMTEKKLNYKAILQTPDTQLHNIFDTEFKH
jgi:succinate dehydrogenase flavin-adding protein (antitoxin of CptAB toxin-antitoxin module)